MFRNILALMLGAVAVALFGYLVFQSRPIPAAEQRAHSILAIQTRSSIDDFRALVEHFASARHAGNDIGPSAAIILERLKTVRSDAAAQLQTVSELPGGSPVGQHLEKYTDSADQLIAASTELATHQDRLAEALESLRQDSARVVQKLRQKGDATGSQSAFVLVTGAMDYARSNSQIDPEALRARAARLARGADAQLAPLLAATEVLLEARPLVDEAWERIAASDFPTHAEALGLAEQARFNVQRSQVDRNRMALSVYAALLLAALAFLSFRLFQSYRVLNAANSELEVLNENLEGRVEARTAELSKALAELKESQVQLVQAAKMSSLGQLVAGISHEINTPLLYLRSNADLIKERLEALAAFLDQLRSTLAQAKGPNRDQAAFIAGLKTIDAELGEDGLGADLEDCRGLIGDSIEGLEQLSEMALSLKDFSRLDRAPVAKYDVNEGLERTLLIAKNALKRKVTIHKRYGDIPHITCSPSQINQVFLNLITNAAQAIEEQGDVAITTKQDGEYIRVTVSDNGCGIPPEQLERIRDPFFTTKTVGEGTGLGLAIVDKIIRAHSGDLIVESEVGKGSAFTVVLPVVAQLTAATGKDQGAAEPLAEAV